MGTVNKSLRVSDWAALASATLGEVGFIWAILAGTRRTELLFKPVVPLCFFLLIVSNRPSLYGRYAAVSMLCSLLGDVLLVFKTQTLFIVGAIAFGFSHFLYAYVFRSLNRRSDWRTFVIIFLPVELFVLYVQLAGHITPYERVLMTSYHTIQAYLLWRAIGTYREHRILWQGVAASFLFIVSDSLITIGKYILPYRSPQNRAVCNSLYFLSQLCFALGAVQEDERASLLLRGEKIKAN